MINCTHWSPCSIPNGGCCAKNLFGGKPSHGTCQQICQAKTPRANNDWLQRGPQLWADLHHWALTSTETSPESIDAFLKSFSSKIPCGDCRRHWLADLQSSPPPLSPSPGNPGEGKRRQSLRAGEGLGPTATGDLFSWTVSRHNQVNARLNKPQMSPEAARLRWNENLSPSVNKNRASAEANAQDLTHFFDAVFCLSLDADTHRWQTFQRQLAVCNWPFGPVRRFPAIHGDTVGVPDHFHQGSGAWGCLQSHRRILELSLMAGYQKILVLEDDVDLRPSFGPQARQFLAQLNNEPWDCLMFGGQHISPPTPHKPDLLHNVVKATNIQRTHCLAFSRNFMRALYRHWSAPLDQHCDWSLGPFAARFNTFAPSRFIAGQRGGPSHITGSPKPPEWWNPPNPTAPVLWLKSPREVLESSRDLFHSGYRRNEHGICLGLADVFNPEKNPTPEKQIAALKSWITMIQSAHPIAAKASPQY